MGFQKATKIKTFLRLAFMGIAGSGKTYSALSIASHLCPPGKRVAVVCAERGSAAKYAADFDFDILTLSSFEPLDYVAALKEAEAGGYGVVILDGISQEWQGALERVDRLKNASRSRNAFTDGWGKVTPEHSLFISTMLQLNSHLIATMRAKVKYDTAKDERTGRMIPQKVGLEPVQREGIEHEFDVFGAFEPQDNTLIIWKTRCKALHEQSYPKPGKEFADIISGWLNSGTGDVPQVQSPKITPKADIEEGPEDIPPVHQTATAAATRRVAASAKPAPAAKPAPETPVAEATAPAPVRAPAPAAPAPQVAQAAPAQPLTAAQAIEALKVPDRPAQQAPDNDGEIPAGPARGDTCSTKDNDVFHELKAVLERASSAESADVAVAEVARRIGELPKEFPKGFVTQLRMLALQVKKKFRKSA